MPQNRLIGVNGPRHPYFGEGGACPFPRPAAQAAVPTGFAPCPTAGMGFGGGWPQMVYWMALAQAREVVRPSWTERALAAGPN